MIKACYNIVYKI